ncbi:hypothetical protein EDEG_01565 [Edhazardia aedis USNM 41457]|uniref:C2H2-type domain-containing protein n=1 Tax=Edhazardia aedis (strain USNM 41457) TaxID=1003232 RepID=J9D9G1_EDHAE|nr:hypothetical protein EDEG_01565 [Edhazardia aedis USNM 41457]|eukprot:EJW04129.1 hypothetical protein EDEG_01565 [Edhazardia aedis USNM 41457]
MMTEKRIMCPNRCNHSSCKKNMHRLRKEFIKNKVEFEENQYTMSKDQLLLHNLLLKVEEDAYFGNNRQNETEIEALNRQEKEFVNMFTCCDRSFNSITDLFAHKIEIHGEDPNFDAGKVESSLKPLEFSENIKNYNKLQFQSSSFEDAEEDKLSNNLTHINTLSSQGYLQNDIFDTWAFDNPKNTGNSASDACDSAQFHIDPDNLCEQAEIPQIQDIKKFKNYKDFKNRFDNNFDFSFSNGTESPSNLNINVSNNENIEINVTNNDGKFPLNCNYNNDVNISSVNGIKNSSNNTININSASKTKVGARRLSFASFSIGNSKEINHEKESKNNTNSQNLHTLSNLSNTPNISHENLYLEQSNYKDNINKNILCSNYTEKTQENICNSNYTKNNQENICNSNYSKNYQESMISSNYSKNNKENTNAQYYNFNYSEISEINGINNFEKKEYLNDIYNQFNYQKTSQPYVSTQHYNKEISQNIENIENNQEAAQQSPFITDHNEIDYVNEKNGKESAENKPYKCSIIGCTKSYTSAYGLRYHQEKGHATYKDEKPYKCKIPGCAKKYKNSNGLKYHMAHGHKTKDNLQCNGN